MLVTLMALEARISSDMFRNLLEDFGPLPVQMSSNHLAILEYGQVY